MAVQSQNDVNTGDTDQSDSAGGQSLKTGAEVQNNSIVTTASGLVQAHTITGGVHHHDHHPGSPTRPVPRQLPPAPHRFVGRVDHLTDLNRHAPSTAAYKASRAEGQQQAPMALISAIGGTGGIGKTWLALTWAHRNLHRFPDGQLFADLHGFSPTGQPAQPVDVLSGFLDALGVHRDHQPADRDPRAALYRSLVADKRILIVLDNAATSEQITPLLPGGRHCTVLITSRNHLHGLATGHGARTVHLEVLTDGDAHTLLATAIGRDRAETDKQAIAELIELCGGFPLALGLIAARTAADPRLPLADTVTELRMLGLDALDSHDPTASLPTVLSWSLRHFTHQQREMFALLGIAPGPDIGLPAAASLAGLPERETHAVLRGLSDASLLDRAAGGRYFMHDLVRAYATTLAGALPVNVREPALRRVLDFYTHTAHAADRLLYPHRVSVQLAPPALGVCSHPLSTSAAAMAWFDSEYACLLAAQHTATTRAWHFTVWHLAWSLHTFNSRRGHLPDRLTVWQAAVIAATHLPDQTTRIHAHRLLGYAYADLGCHKDALDQLHHALAIAEHHHDPTHLARTHRALAWVWARRGDARRALEHACHALDLHRSLDQPAWEADALNMMGRYAARLGDYDTARHHCQAALVLHRHHNNSEGEAGALDSLGYTDHQSGHHLQAIDHYHSALNLFHDLGSSYEVANTLDGLGHPHAALGQHEQARAVWQLALRLYKEQNRHNDAAHVQRQLDDLVTSIGSGPPHMPC
ncbi:tetratricopeptide repeat protein [Crossiella sp. SN42]|uniref:ATP-binding protein n=1 Tax=Crossiella sp. SN42 TaxID=2944808 RepID=UPI00207CEFC1|nr:tetratricopeptide repeat protein [Crossiella sp. SN42]MCO1575110.1 tetratricopeptide repeat protein [Crossiella sp. SN42]